MRLLPAVHGGCGVQAGVIPLLDGGLHCGGGFSRAARAGGGVIPLLDGGLHCGPACYFSRTNVPQVIPLLDGGLHCGDGRNDDCLAIVPVIPLLDGGLHCGTCQVTPLPLVVTGHPAARRRAPLRRVPAAGMG